MTEILIVKKSELEEIVKSVVEGVINKPQPAPAIKQALNLQEAADYLAEKGLNIKKSTLYAHTMKKTIPFRRFGKKKIVFDRQELDQWANDRLK